MRGGRFKNPELQADWNEHGEEAFVFEVLERDIWKQGMLDLMETAHVSVARKKGENPYNLETGGKSGYKLAKSTKSKITDKQTGGKQASFW